MVSATIYINSINVYQKLVYVFIYPCRTLNAINFCRCNVNSIQTISRYSTAQSLPMLYLDKSYLHISGYALNTRSTKSVSVLRLFIDLNTKQTNRSFLNVSIPRPVTLEWRRLLGLCKQIVDYTWFASSFISEQKAIHQLFKLRSTFRQIGGTLTVRLEYTSSNSPVPLHLKYLL